MLKGRKLSDTYLATIPISSADEATVLAESSNLLSFFIVICALQRCLRIVAR